MCNILRYFILFWTMTINISSSIYSNPVRYSDIDLFDQSPCVWRSLTSPYLDIQKQLYKEITTTRRTPDDGKQNWCAVTLRLYGSDPSSPLSIDVSHINGKIIKSNHLYTADGRFEFNKRFREKSLNVKKIQLSKVVAEMNRSSSEDFFHNDTDIIFFSRISKMLNDLRLEAATFRCLNDLEQQYQLKYPFHNKRKLFDSEVSCCFMLDHLISSLQNEIKESSTIYVHMHSERPSCFYCLHLLHVSAKKWSAHTEKPCVIMVSSHPNPDDPKWSIWSGSLPFGHESCLNNHTLDMRDYGKDDRYDEPLSPDELNEFTYFPEKSGKIIQTFFQQDLTSY